MCVYNTVGGRDPAPVDMVNIPLFAGFYTSQVVQDFFHQQYVYIFKYSSLISLGSPDVTTYSSHNKRPTHDCAVPIGILRTP